MKVQGYSTVTAADANIAAKAVRYDAAQSLTAAQQLQGRQNVYAASFDAMAYSGMQINGGMEVSQENGVSAVSVTNTRKYVVDGWTIDTDGATQVLTGTQVFISPDGITTSLQVAVQTANASPASSNFVRIIGRIEGYRVSRLMWGAATAAPMTLSFWVRAIRIGNYSVAIINGASTRSYATTFAVNVTNTWEYKTITIPGDTTGTWARDNTLAMDICFTMMAGSGRVGAANTWTSGVILGVTGTVNGVAATSDAMWVTGVTVLPGTQAPTAAQSPNIMRAYGEELVTCKRYWEKTRLFNYGYSAAGTNNAGISTQFMVEKRVIPTIVLTANAMFNCTFSTNQATVLYLQTVGNVTAAGNFSIDATFTADARL